MPHNPSSTSKAQCCPLCDRPADSRFKPFCSAGCRDRDLLQWLGEGYRIPGPRAENADEEQFER